MVKKEKKSWSGWAIFGVIILCLLLVGALCIGFVAMVIVSSGETTSVSADANVALIKINSEIATESTDDLFTTSGVVSSTKIVKQLQEIAKDDSIKGVIFEINSPGGSGVASDEIATAIKNLNKPTVSYVREVGASGAYWIASSTDYIYANKFSTVGSIGVIASYLDFSEALTEWNITYQQFIAGDNKDFGSPYRAPTDIERKRFQMQLDELRLLFVEQVAENRNLSVDYVSTLADGFIYTTSQAIDNGLIDEIGGKNDAMLYLQDLLLENVSVVEYGYTPGFLDKLFGTRTDAMRQIGVGIGSVLIGTQKTGVVVKT